MTMASDNPVVEAAAASPTRPVPAAVDEPPPPLPWAPLSREPFLMCSFGGFLSCASEGRDTRYADTCRSNRIVWCMISVVLWA